jgi:hypothetical protein
MSFSLERPILNVFRAESTAKGSRSTARIAKRCVFIKRSLAAEML